MSLAVKIALIAVLIFVEAMFTTSKTAVIELNDGKIHSLADDGDKKAKKILKLTDNGSNSSKFLSVVQIISTFTGFFICACAVLGFDNMLSGVLQNCFGVNKGTAAGTATYYLSVALIVLITAFITLVLGIFVPKKIVLSSQNPEKIAYRTVGFMLFFEKLLTPMTALSSACTNGIVRLFGLNPKSDDENVTEEEIRMMVDVGEESGAIEESEREMINNIFEFDDTDVGDVMQHRTEITAVELHDDISHVLELAITEGFSRIPVYDEDIDNIVGVIYVKDLLKYVGKTVPKSITTKSIMRPAYHVPESKHCSQLFAEMTERHIQLAIVIDEYGGTAGLVTLEDLIESILGNIQDEYDDEEQEIQKVDDTTYTIDGTCDIEEVEEMLSVKLPEGDYDTIGGLILSVLGRLPDESENPSIECAGYRFTIEKLDERHIELVKAEKLSDEAQAENSKEENNE